MCLYSDRQVSFLIIFNRMGECNSVDGFDEGVEFSVHLSSLPTEWIPIKYIYFGTDESNDIFSIGSFSDNFTIRGYFVDQCFNVTSSRIKINICNFNTSDIVQFRWLQTSEINTNINRSRDVWIIDEIEISVVTPDLDSVTLLNETFDSGSLE